jgi:nitroreductase
MQVIEALKSRHSVRAFTSDPIDRTTLAHILRAALHAPSWANTQPWEVFVATGDPLERLRAANLDAFHRGVPRNPDFPSVQSWPEPHRLRMAEVQGGRSTLLGLDLTDPDQLQTFTEPNFRFFGAPAVIFLCMHRELSSWSLFDIGALALAVMLAAEEQGVSSIPAFSFGLYPDLVRTELSIPPEFAVVVGIALGRPNSEHPLAGFRSGRRPFDEVVHFIDA